MPRKPLALFMAALLSSATLGLSACQSALSTGPRNADNPAHSAPVEPVPISDAEFASSVRRVLSSSEQTVERTNLLAGIVRHQLERAKQRFSAGHPDAGLRAVHGAFYLLRAGELRPEMLSGGVEALLAASSETARLGDAGRSLALYEMLLQVLPPGDERADVEAHLAALAYWSRTTRPSSPMQASATEQQVAVHRALLDATRPALGAARDATVSWMRRALDMDLSELRIQSSLDHEESLEALRAQRMGWATLSALYLRHGDPLGAMQTIVEQDLERAAPDAFLEQLELAGENNDSAAWLSLFRVFSGADETLHMDPELAAAASWGAALGLYQSQSDAFENVAPLAAVLVDNGLGEAAPLLLGEALAPEPDPRELSFALGFVLNAMIIENQIDQLDSARRTFESAQKILKVASRPALRGSVRPSAARVRFVMGTLETRSGNLTDARPLLARAAADEPSVEALSTLAAIDRQKKRPDLALRSLNAALELSRREGDLIAQTELLLKSFEIHRSTKDGAAARKTLAEALSKALDARELARSAPNQARTERLLARVLELYGHEEGARRATERAYEAARTDVQQMAATVLDASRRALTQVDLTEARAALNRALESNLEADDLVYVALWLQLVERHLNVSSDGSTEEAYEQIEESSGWPAKLRSWGRGKLNDQGLLAAARDPAQRTEAKFYAAMAGAASGHREQALAHLREVAHSEAIDLMEVTIARDLIIEHSTEKLELSLPSGVDVP